MAEREKVARSKQHTVYKNAAGKRLPGSTTVLGVIDKPALKFWANTIGLEGIMIREYVDGLAEIGTLAHEMVHSYLRDKPMNLDDWAPNQVKAATVSYDKFREWALPRKIEVILAEEPMVSELYQFGGTPDIIARVDGVLTLIDIKTSKAIYDEHAWQVSSYCKLAEENHIGGESIKQGLIVQIGRNKEEGFTTKTLNEQQLFIGWQVFLDAIRLRASIRSATAKK